MRAAAGLAVLAGLVALAGCSGLTDTGTGIVGIEVTIPAPDSIAIGDSLRLSARALDKNGDSVATTIVWATPDTAILTVNSASGIVTGRSVGVGRVQAITSSLASALVTVTVFDASTSPEVVRPRR